MSEQEPHIIEYLIKIAASISMGILWLLINCTIGVGLNYAFFTYRPTLANYIFYAFFLLTGYFLFRYLKRKWRF